MKLLLIIIMKFKIVITQIKKWKMMNLKNLQIFKKPMNQIQILLKKIINNLKIKIIVNNNKWRKSIRQIKIKIVKIKKKQKKLIMYILFFNKFYKV